MVKTTPVPSNTYMFIMEINVKYIPAGFWNVKRGSDWFKSWEGKEDDLSADVPG